MVKRQRTLLRDLARALRSYLSGRPVPDQARDALRRYNEQFPEPGSAERPTHHVCPCGTSH